jgi:hypothetical protein
MMANKWYDYLLDPMEGINDALRATTGELFFPRERLDRYRREQVLGPPRELQRSPTLGNLGEGSVSPQQRIEQAFATVPRPAAERQLNEVFADWLRTAQGRPAGAAPFYDMRNWPPEYVRDMLAPFGGRPAVSEPLLPSWEEPVFIPGRR